MDQADTVIEIINSELSMKLRPLIREQLDRGVPPATIIATVTEALRPVIETDLCSETGAEFA